MKIYISYNLQHNTQEVLQLQRNLEAQGHVVLKYTKGSEYDPELLENSDVVIFLLPRKTVFMDRNMLRRYDIGKGQTDELETVTRLEIPFYFMEDSEPYLTLQTKNLCNKIYNLTPIDDGVDYYRHSSLVVKLTDFKHIDFTNLTLRNRVEILKSSWRNEPQSTPQIPTTRKKLLIR